MTTSVDRIRKWLSSAASNTSVTHMLVCYDDHSNDYYPVNIHKGDNPLEVIAKQQDKVKECYALHIDLGLQLSELRTWHPELPGSKQADPQLVKVNAKSLAFYPERLTTEDKALLRHQCEWLLSGGHLRREADGIYKEWTAVADPDSRLPATTLEQIFLPHALYALLLLAEKK